ncbi:MAG: hypothetical protein KAR83_07365 [Thermodesulfovibrionales bacterium]|nr:hypothetical protein [Thermodesulfovibrionales bacterium]
MRLATLFLFATVAVAIIAPACGASADEGFRLSSNREVSEIMPESPVRVKLKKLADGTYTWEISGTDVQNIIDADSALRKYIKENGLKSK